MAALTGLALVLAACGSSQETAVETGAEGPTAEAAQSDLSESAASSEPATTAEPAATAAEPSESEPSETEAVAENLFPDIEVLSIADGSSVNLATELGGGDLPVLLWFWAPH